MKKYLYLATTALASCCAVSSSCSDDKVSGDSIFSAKAVERNTFNQWLHKNYTMPYNIDFQYRSKTEETKQVYNLVPADSAKTAKLAVPAKYMWLDAYAETVGLDLIKESVLRIILVAGTSGYTRYCMEVIGSVEGGYKVRLGKVNAPTDEQLKDYDSMNNYYFHTMYHEFMHIFNQKKPYDESYDNISRSDYVSGSWAPIPDGKVRSMSLVSAYSTKNPAEDIAEFYSIYVTSTSEDWAIIMKNTGNKGGMIINKKLKIIREYMNNSWNVDIELLRSAILRKGGKISTFDLNTLE